MKIGILQTGHVPEELEEFGSYPDMFQRLLEGRGFEFETFAVVDNVLPDSAERCDGWLVTGSRHGAYEDHPWIPPLEALIRDAYAKNIPMVGICFGHQIIAQALGGQVEKFDGGWAVGSQDYEFNGTKITQNAWHQDQVIKRPADASVVASNAFCENAALVYGDKAFTVQWHPEFDSDFVDGLIRTRGKGVVPDDILARATDALDRPTDKAVLADRIGTFFLERRIS